MVPLGNKASPRAFRFGPFELDVKTAELRKHGVKLRLHEQPFRILVMLLERPGEAVSREDLRKVLWPNDTVVEFEHSINAAIQRLRDALGDSAGSPRYVETLPRRGYRFIGTVEVEAAPEPEPEPHYHLLDKLGEGGMGVVYRAEDLRLRRQVAIKFPAESMFRRFEREARAAAALNHPHICTVYGLEEIDGKPAIVMELMEGETLAERLAKGAMPREQALALAAQICDALAEAHRRGVVHRDLKPANIMLTKSGAKVLDFGLAKMERAVALMADVETETQKGAILGTLHYMSPEQVQGKEIDSRSDIFSFGLVLYEMLAGRRAFEGDSAASVMAGILEREPATVASGIPPALNRLLLRCLAKDPEERWQSARDLKTVLAECRAEAPLEAGARPAWVAWTTAGLLAAALAVTLFIHLRERPSEQRVVRLQISPPGNDPFVSMDTPVVSPDGTRIVFSNGGKLFVRSMDSLAAQELPGTAGGLSPFWSSDGRSLGFIAGQKLKRTDLLSGSPTVVSTDSAVAGGSWNRDGVILFAPNRFSPLMRILAGGGSAVPATRLDAAKGETSHRWPAFLPDGQHFLFTVYAREPANTGVFVGSLNSPQVMRLLPEETNAQYTEPGYILFSRGGNLMTQPFDARRLRLTGDPFLVAQDVSASTNQVPFAPFSASAGVLAYRLGRWEGSHRFGWFDRRGNHLGEVGVAGDFPSWALSPDSQALAVAMRSGSHPDIWVFDLVRGTNSRLTYGGGGEPSWSPDGRQLAFAIVGESPSVIRRIAADGSGKQEVVARLDRLVTVDQWTADGQYLILSADIPGKPFEVWAVPLSSGKPFPVVAGASDNSSGNVSPDGKWIAYVGNGTGGWEVYIQDFPPRERKWQISTAGGLQPFWRADGRALFYESGSKVMSVDVRIDAVRLEAGIPKPVADLPAGGHLAGFSADGQKSLLMIPNEDTGPHLFTVAINWPAAIKR